MTIKQRLSDQFRAARDRRLRTLLAECPRQSATLRVLDIGGRASYWERVGFDFLREIDAHVTLLNLSEDELRTDYRAAEGLITGAIGSGCALDYPDGHFDLSHSNSVIEHVGLWRDMRSFAAETRRVARSYYVQTPNYWFPVDPHYWRMPLFHWLPRPCRAALVRAFPLAHGGRALDVAHAYDMVDAARLLTRGQMRALFPESRLDAEGLSLWPKSFIAIGSPVHL